MTSDLTREALAEALFDALGWAGTFRYHPEDEKIISGDYSTYRAVPVGIVSGDIDHPDWQAFTDRVAAKLAGDDR